MSSPPLPRLSTADRPEQLVLAGVALTAEPSLDGVLNRVVGIAADVIGAKYAPIGVLAPDGSSVRMTITFGDRTVVYRLEDDGPGIPESEREP